MHALVGGFNQSHLFLRSFAVLIRNMHAKAEGNHVSLHPVLPPLFSLQFLSAARPEKTLGMISPLTAHPSRANSGPVLFLPPPFTFTCKQALRPSSSLSFHLPKRGGKPL